MMSRPEDILNVSIQSQEISASEEDCFKLKDIMNEELQGSMASEAVALLSSSADHSVAENDGLRDLYHTKLENNCLNNNSHNCSEKIRARARV